MPIHAVVGVILKHKLVVSWVNPFHNLNCVAQWFNYVVLPLTTLKHYLMAVAVMNHTYGNMNSYSYIVRGSCTRSLVKEKAQ